MKSSRVKKYFSGLFTEYFPGYVYKNGLLYREDLSFCLSGFCFESSGYGADDFALWVFQMPLVVPSDFVTLTIGNRIGGAKGWWTIKEDDEHLYEITNAIIQVMKDNEEKKLIHSRTLLDFISFLDRTYADVNDPYILEEIAYYRILLDQAPSESIKKILTNVVDIADKTIQKMPAIEWIKHNKERAQLILDYLELGQVESAKSQIYEWRDYTVEKLKLRR